MKDLSFRTLLLAVVIPLIIVALGMWRTYSTMDYVYATKTEMWVLEKTVALQAKDYELIRVLLEKIDKKIDKKIENIQP